MKVPFATSFASNCGPNQSVSPPVATRVEQSQHHLSTRLLCPSIRPACFHMRRARREHGRKFGRHSEFLSSPEAPSLTQPGIIHEEDKRDAQSFAANISARQEAFLSGTIPDNGDVDKQRAWSDTNVKTVSTNSTNEYTRSYEVPDASSLEVGRKGVKRQRVFQPPATDAYALGYGQPRRGFSSVPPPLAPAAPAQSDPNFGPCPPGSGSCSASRAASDCASGFMQMGRRHGSRSRYMDSFDAPYGESRRDMFPMTDHYSRSSAQMQSLAETYERHAAGLRAASGGGPHGYSADNERMDAERREYMDAQRGLWPPAAHKGRGKDVDMFEEGPPGASKGPGKDGMFKVESQGTALLSYDAPRSTAGYYASRGAVVPGGMYAGSGYSLASDLREWPPGEDKGRGKGVMFKEENQGSALLSYDGLGRPTGYYTRRDGVDLRGIYAGPRSAYGSDRYPPGVPLAAGPLRTHPYETAGAYGSAGPYGLAEPYGPYSAGDSLDARSARARLAEDIRPYGPRDGWYEPDAGPYDRIGRHAPGRGSEFRSSLRLGPRTREATILGRAFIQFDDASTGDSGGSGLHPGEL